MTLRSCFSALAAAVLLAHRAPAQATTGDADVAGIWRGTSVCQVRPSACHDEIVIYRITRAKAGDSVSVDGRRIVNASEVEMGILPCRLAARGASITCTIPNGVWRFTTRGDSLVGDLRLSDNTKFREVHAARARQ